MCDQGVVPWTAATLKALFHVKQWRRLPVPIVLAGARDSIAMDATFHVKQRTYVLDRSECFTWNLRAEGLPHKGGLP